MGGRSRRQPRTGRAEVAKVLSQQALGALALLAHRADVEETAGEHPMPIGLLHRECVGLILRAVWLACAADLGLLPGRELDAPWRRGEHDPATVVSHLEDSWSAFARHSGSGVRPASSATFLGRMTWLDGPTVNTLLRLLLTVDGHRIAFDELDVEALGHVYEALLGVQLERTETTSLCLRPFATWVRIDDILAEDADIRAKWLQRVAGLPKTAVQKLSEPLGSARREVEVLECLERFRTPGTAIATRGRLVVQRDPGRRSSGSHYTPRVLTKPVVARTLGPLLVGRTSEELLSLRICDAAMGAGAFLIEACRFVAEHLMAAWVREGRVSKNDETARTEARRAVAEKTLYGVDRNPAAVEVGRFLLGLVTARSGAPLLGFSERLVVGDALVDRKLGLDDDLAFSWHRRFSDVFTQPSGGFDAFVGNPPWVAYAGRAAQPIDDRLAAYYRQRTHAFAGYPTLHGLFVWRTASLLRPGGRLGLVLPTSVSDLAGYAPTRRAHDSLCEPDVDLTDFGDGAFVGVFQPCMALTSTRRAEMTRIEKNEARHWPLERPDLGADDARLLEYLIQLPPLPATLFGERGYQSTGNDLSHIRRMTEPRPPFTVALREGSDVTEFATAPATLFMDPTRIVGRFRSRDDWQSVRILIRQTARFPIAAIGDGTAFRNSILAGFADETWSEYALLCYLNSSPIRWYHFFRHRDARQGMPQLKIGHLRALPNIPPRGEHVKDALDVLGRVISRRNGGVRDGERREIDALVAEGLRLECSARERITAWAEKHRPPLARHQEASPVPDVSSVESP